MFPSVLTEFFQQMKWNWISKVVKGAILFWKSWSFVIAPNALVPMKKYLLLLVELLCSFTLINRTSLFVLVVWMYFPIVPAVKPSLRHFIDYHQRLGNFSCKKLFKDNIFCPYSISYVSEQEPHLIFVFCCRTHFVFSLHEPWELYKWYVMDSNVTTCQYKS